MDEPDFRRAISRFATGVTVVTARTGDRTYGMTLSAMTSLSLEPPSLLVCINRRVPTEQAVASSGKFVVNVLADYQERIARRFARPAADKFDGVDIEFSRTGIPVLKGTVASFECTVRERLAGGTHSIFVGHVDSARFNDRLPLVYHAAGFGDFNSRTGRTVAEGQVGSDQFASFGTTPTEGLAGVGAFFSS
ncbi:MULTISPECIES: flavin reductase family protein [Amycolatopsis]|uniref:Flavin reductase (DIM6/NTAB) family NADH-FMN oxidoreductase RutF n=1 Tax=Amycolatopsis echigonensis TaxID=2576905 RepID=A0A2N3WN84_9PSEU|nr:MULTISPECIES: flavin reductase family protein [Amycolatopsis]PKV95330.1 flavin reductase (DIM6/NTAB) family NADH-FMN oxidoreductase RutF [Amycolatopsis niigatensis]